MSMAGFCVALHDGKLRSFQHFTSFHVTATTTLPKKIARKKYNKEQSDIFSGD